MERALEAAGKNGALVYMALCIRESKTPPEHKAAFKASSANLERDSGVSARTVARILPVLVRAKLIEIKSGRHGGENHAHEANTFRILDLPLMTGSHKPYEISDARDGRQKRNSPPMRGRKFKAPAPSGCTEGAPEGGARAKKSNPFIF